MINTYCYAHGLVYGGCVVCEANVASMLRGDRPYLDDISALEAYTSCFPQVG